MDLYVMNCELLATCSALGYLEGDTYHKEPDCLESVKDLIRYLRHEDDTRDTRQQLGAGQILQNDLLPIITQHSQDKSLFDACIRLMVNLTQPALLCFGKVPDDPTVRHHFLEVVSYLQAYKEAFANEKVFGVLSETLYTLLQLDWEQRQEEDNLLIERILLLVRNVLHVPADPYEEKNVDDDASVHDKLLWAIHMSGLDDLIKFLASAQSEQQWSMHVLEVISLMFRDQTPELLVSAGQARSAQEKQRDAQELEALRQKEQAEKRSRTLQRGTRHSRFGGSYVVQGLKSIGEKDVIYHRGLHNFKNYTHDEGKAVRRVPKRKLHARDSEGKRRSALNVRLFLREFCMDFLENCYNRLMMHLALKAYQELLLTVNEMDRSRDEDIRQSANVIKSNIFYLMEYREIFLTLLRKFDETKQPRTFLRDLVESTHLFLRMLERFCKGRNNLVVQRKRVKRKKSKGRKNPTAAENTPEELEETWGAVAEELRALTEGAVPFDAASETPLEEQRTEAMVRVQDTLLNRLGPEALGLLRAAREVWPEGDVFGSADVEPEEELELLKQILIANLPRPPPPEPGMEEEDGELEEEEELESVRVSETEFNFLDFIKRFANPNVVRPYLLLLRSYSQNSPHTNHCITRMLHRLAVDLKMDALLFQLSVFCLFNKILGDPAATAYKELVTFAKFVLNRFFALAAKNNKAFVELLFWKSVGAAREMTEGYSKPGEGCVEGSNKKAKWTPEEEDELRTLYEEHRDSEVPDIVETLLPLLSNTTRTRRQVVAQLVAMGLVDSVKELKKQRKGTRIVLWTEEQEEELQMLFEEFRDSDDVLGNILKKVTAKRSRARMVEKLLSMGLVSDRRELHKKRRRNPNAPGKSTEEEFLAHLPGGLTEEPMDEDEEGEEEEEEEEDEEESEGEERERQAPAARGRKSWMAERESMVEKKASLRTMVYTLRQEGMSGPLLWLQNCLNRTADHREEEGLFQPVPIVPLTEENEDAMEKKSFQRLLRKIGVRAPADEQESFWRIPAQMRPSQLRGAAEVLSPSQDALAAGTEESEQPTPGNSHEQRTQALRALLLARKMKQPSTSAEHTGQQIRHWLSEMAPYSLYSALVLTRTLCVLVQRSALYIKDSPLTMDLGADGGADSDREAHSAPAKRKRQRVLIDDDEDD
uniref:Timeless circadian clock n=1 Tax=Oncorhynchus kisutch TaxID=8019 RepID=A0A8C7CSX4_ONCKI